MRQLPLAVMTTPNLFALPTATDDTTGDFTAAKLHCLGGTAAVWKAGEWIRFPGAAVADPVPFLVGGRARVLECDAEGHEITLYRLEPGHGHCGLSMASAVAGIAFPAAIRAETDSTGFIVGVPEIRRAMDRDTTFRTAVLRSVAERALHLLGLLAEVAFTPMDQRLAALLLRRAGEASEPLHAVTVTHRELAVELGTAREVVSRLLELFEHAGAVKLERGRIQFTPASAAFLRSRARVD